MRVVEDRAEAILAKRYYYFNVYSDRKIAQKLHYMHWNRVRRGLVSAPELWRWSSYRTFAFQEQGPVTLNWQEQPNATSKAGIATNMKAHPPKTTEDGAPSTRSRQEKTKPQ